MSWGDDHGLIRAIRERSPEALAELYDRHGGTVLALASRILGDAAEAEEVLEDVFWGLWQEVDRYDPGRGSPIAYLLLRVRSRALDRLRARRRQTSRLVAVGASAELEAFGDPAGGGSCPFDGTLASEHRAHLRAALAQLDDDQRRVVELSFIDGLSHSEIAERLSVPLGTVKTRIRRGLLLLRKALVGRLPRGEVA